MQHNFDINSIKKSEFIKNKKLKPLDKRKAIKLAAKISEGFDDIDLKNIKPSQYRRAQSVIKTWINAIESGNNRIVRPSVKNRAAYAQFSDLPSNFKIYAMPVIEKSDKFKVKKGKVVRVGDHITTNDYYFKDPKKAMKETDKETAKLLKQIDKDYKGKVSQLFIRVGKHETKVKYPKETVADQIKAWTNQYGIEKTQQFIFGLRVFSFNGQVTDRPSRLKMKKGYKRK